MLVLQATSSRVSGTATSRTEMLTAQTLACKTTGTSLHLKHQQLPYMSAGSNHHTLPTRVRDLSAAECQQFTNYKCSSTLSCSAINLETRVYKCCCTYMSFLAYTVTVPATGKCCRCLEVNSSHTGHPPHCVSQLLILQIGICHVSLLCQGSATVPM